MTTLPGTTYRETRKSGLCDHCEQPFEDHQGYSCRSPETYVQLTAREVVRMWKVRMQPKSSIMPLAVTANIAETWERGMDRAVTAFERALRHLT